MKLELVNRLLEVKMTISFKGKTKIIDKLVIDTGAAHTLLSSDIVEDLVYACLLIRDTLIFVKGRNFATTRIVLFL